MQVYRCSSAVISVCLTVCDYEPAPVVSCCVFLDKPDLIHDPRYHCFYPQCWRAITNIRNPAEYSRGPTVLCKYAGKYAKGFCGYNAGMFM